MKTIKAKDAKFGEWYRDHKYGNVKCVSESDETKLAGFVTRSGTFRFFGDPREIEHLPECDSFDWQPAAEGSNGVRWFVGKGAGRYVFMSHEDGDMCFKPGREEISPSLIGDLAKRSDIKEITTAEALALIGANDWSEGVAKAKELAGIVDEVETEPSPVSVMDSMLNAMGYKRCDTEPAPKEANTVLTDLVSGKWKESEEVRWYLDEYENSIRGYWTGEKILFDEDGDSLYANEITDESHCIDDNDTKLSTPEVLCRLARAGHVAAWNEARKLAGLNEQEAYLAGQSVCGLEVGDTVRVVRVADSKEMGWRLLKPKDEYRCTNGEIQEISGYGIGLVRNPIYPYFVLEKIETPADEATPVETPAEVATESDPGEGWRLIDKAVDEPMEGDERWGNLTHEWKSRMAKSTSPFQSDVTYRRRIQPAADHVNKWAGGYWSLGKWVSGRPFGVEVAQ